MQLARFLMWMRFVACALADATQAAIAQQQTLAFLPLIVTQKETLLEEHVKAAGLGATAVT